MTFAINVLWYLHLSSSLLPFHTSLRIWLVHSLDIVRFLFVCECGVHVTMTSPDALWWDNEAWKMCVREKQRNIACGRNYKWLANSQTNGVEGEKMLHIPDRQSIECVLDSQNKWQKNKKWRENRYSSTRYLVDWSAAHRTQYTSKRCLGAFTSPSNCSNAALSATLIDVRLRGGWPFCVVQWRSAGHGSYRRAQHR